MQSLCGAYCRTTEQPCKNHPMANGRCRMHGGKSTGRPATHGMFTKLALQRNAEVRQLRRTLADFKKHLAVLR